MTRRSGATRHDVVILGGGAAGCVLAERLSQDPDRSVCLVEAGPDYGPDQRAWPAKVLDARILPRDDVWEPHAAAHRIRARLLGGSSCINGCWNTWGASADYAEWARLGGPTWSAPGLEPFRRVAVEQMQLLPVPERELSPWSSGALTAAGELGYPLIADMSAPGGGPGCGTPLINAVDGHRRNVAFAYLGGARSRPNLSIVSAATAERLVVRDGRIHCVDVAAASRRVTFVADTYVVSCGTFGSPTLLMRSGIGPAAHLAEVGVRPELDLPGVGANLIDQPGVFLPLVPTNDLNAALADKEASGELYVSRSLIRAASEYCPEGAWDLHILPTAGPPLFGRLPPGQYEAGISAFLMKPASRGCVRLRSADPTIPPEIDPAFMSDAGGRDLAVVRAGLEIVGTLTMSSALKSLAGPTHGQLPHTMTEQQLRTRLGTYWHPVGTCAMGAHDDNSAVVDGLGRVRGLSNLRIVDASILPTVPAANTQLSVLAVAEMMAESLKG